MFRNLFFLLLMTTAFGSIGAQNQVLTPELLWKIGRLGLDDVSPDGRYAVYGVQRYNIENNNGKRQLFLIDLKDGTSRALTPEDASCSEARFHPDGSKIGFLKEGVLNEVELTGGRMVEVSDEKMNGFAYAPDGSAILFIQRVKYEQMPSEKYKDLGKTTGRVIDGLFYRHWKSWSDYKHSNIFYAKYKNGKLTSKPLNIMDEPYDSPLSPMGGMEQITWSPDAKFILYTCRKLASTAETQSTNSDIYLYEIASGATLKVSEGLPGYDLDPVFSPDGKYLAWTSMERAGYEADRTRIMLLDTRNNLRRELTKGWDYQANHPHWSADGQSLYFLSSTDFTYQLYEWPIDATEPRRITNGRHDYTNFKVAGDQLIATRNAMDMPAELYSVDPATGKAKQLTRVTDDPWANIEKGRVERRTVQTKDGKDMNVWLIFPPGFDPEKKYPALLYCQGGPQSALSQFFSYRWNFQMMAANGYVVIAPCRRGMPGAGQEWCDAIAGDWGGKPMQDYLDATDALSKEPWIDEQRLGAIGASYGGYSVYWLAGNHNKRFKAFISHCGLFNLESWYGTTEELWFANHDIKGPYWDPENKADYEKFSPHRYVDNWDTPMLVIHNELDFRVPLGEGMQAFQAAQLRGIPSKMLYFPDEGHWVSKPQNSLLWQREFAAWLNQYLKQP